jgi:predicted O-methyltransferase YrrM
MCPYNLLIQKAKNYLAKSPFFPKAESLLSGLPVFRRLFGYQFPAGHFYSPIPSKQEILRREKQIIGMPENGIAGIDLNEKEQLDLLEKIKPYYREIPFKNYPQKALRYYYSNNYYGHSDAIFLYGMLRLFRPRKIIEIGSGFSSAVMLDTADNFLGGACEITFIEPFPGRLLTLLNEQDRKKHKLFSSQVQGVSLDHFTSLQDNDVLFVDSSHVSKAGSDLNHIVFDILPILKPGVLIHFHDISYPFEYPKEWILRGRAWNESYLLRAFLQYNSKFKIALFNTFLEYYHEDWFRENMPDCLINRGGSIWLRKL